MADVINIIQEPVSSTSPEIKIVQPFVANVFGYVPESRMIAGIDLRDNITASELKTALLLNNVVNVGSSAIPVKNGTDNFTTGGAYTELKKKVNTSNVDQEFFDNLFRKII